MFHNISIRSFASPLIFTTIVYRIVSILVEPMPASSPSVHERALSMTNESILGGARVLPFHEPTIVAGKWSGTTGTFDIL